MATRLLTAKVAFRIHPLRSLTKITKYYKVLSLGVAAGYYSFHRCVKADDGIMSSLSAMSPMSIVNAIKLETTGYGNQFLVPMEGGILSFKQSWGDYFSRYLKIWNFTEAVRELHITFDASVDAHLRGEVGRTLHNHIIINGGITPKQIASIINAHHLEMMTNKMDMGTLEENHMEQEKSWKDWLDPNEFLKMKDFRLIDINIVIYGSKECLPPFRF